MTTTTCPTCSGTGRVTVPEWRGANTGELNQPEHEAPCAAKHCEDGKLIAFDCEGCAEELALDDPMHVCTDYGYRLCAWCARDNELHAPECRAERAEAACEGDR